MADASGRIVVVYGISEDTEILAVGVQENGKVVAGYIHESLMDIGIDDIWDEIKSAIQFDEEAVVASFGSMEEFLESSNMTQIPVWSFELVAS